MSRLRKRQAKRLSREELGRAHPAEGVIALNQRKILIVRDHRHTGLFGGSCDQYITNNVLLACMIEMWARASGMTAALVAFSAIVISFRRAAYHGNVLLHPSCLHFPHLLRIIRPRCSKALLQHLLTQASNYDRRSSAQLGSQLRGPTSSLCLALISPVRSALALVVFLALRLVVVVVSRHAPPFASPVSSISTINQFLRKAGFIPYEDLD